MALALAWVLVACSGTESKLPSLDVADIDLGDSIAIVMLSGSESSRVDTLRLDESTTIEPDTTRYDKAWVVSANGAGVYYYRLVQGVWRQMEPDTVREAAVESVQDIVGRESSGKDLVLSGEYQGRRLAIVFSGLDLSTHTRAERDSLRRMARPDSLQFVYMMLTPSDSAARARIRRDSLSGLIFSDTLGVVSALRNSYGIDRKATRQIFLVDSTRKRVQPIP